jgi:hypothetical protein
VHLAGLAPAGTAGVVHHQDGVGHGVAVALLQTIQ